MQIHSIYKVLEIVKEAGAIAAEEQDRLAFEDRGYKEDGSIITEVDTKIDRLLSAKISGLYPFANILSEEIQRFFDPQKPYTFAIDPIDGSDSFSQNMPGWCIAVGLLNQQLQPVAGIVYAPGWDVLFFADIGKEAIYNGRAIDLTHRLDVTSPKVGLMVSSKIYREVVLDRFHGKLRSVGSTALHICMPLIYGGVVGSLSSSKAHIWDIAAAHAINLSLGWDLELLSGAKIDYSKLTDGGHSGEVILSGSKTALPYFRAVFRK
jgi:myo-inositol-1(or 4)-monophosphatase